MKRLAFNLLYRSLLIVGWALRICLKPIDWIIFLNFILADIPLSIAYQLGLLLTGWGEERYPNGFMVQYRRRPWRLGPFNLYPWHFLAWALLLWLAFAPLPLRPFIMAFQVTWSWTRWMLLCIGSALACGFANAVWQQTLKRFANAWLAEFHQFFQQRIAA